MSPLLVRAYTRDQEIAAALRAADLLGLMGHETPRRLLAGALREASKVNGPPRGGWLAAGAAQRGCADACERVPTVAAPPPP